MHARAPAVHQPTVVRAPRRGHTEQVGLVLHQEGEEPIESLLASLEKEFRKLPSVKEVIPGSPRRGKRQVREVVDLTIRFVKKVSMDEAERIAKKVVAMIKERQKRSTRLRATRRNRAQERRQNGDIRRAVKLREREKLNKLKRLPRSSQELAALAVNL